MPSSVFNKNAVFISAVMFINSAQVSGFVIFPDDLRFLALLLPVKVESRAKTLAAWVAASSAAASSASACSSSACFSAAICSSSATSVSKRSISSSSAATLLVVVMLATENGVLLATSAVIGTEVVGGSLVSEEVVGVVEHPQEEAVEDTPAIRSSFNVVERSETEWEFGSFLSVTANPPCPAQIKDLDQNLLF